MSDELTEKGIIYLVQPIGLCKNYYKVGMSNNSSLKRIFDYHQGTRYLAIFECENPKYIEKYILDYFNTLYKKPFGKEYYECDDEYHIFSCFVKIIVDYKKYLLNIKNLQNGNIILMTDDDPL